MDNRSPQEKINADIKDLYDAALAAESAAKAARAAYEAARDTYGSNRWQRLLDVGNLK